MSSALIVLLVAALLARWVVSGLSRGGTSELPAAHVAEVARLREEVDGLQAEVSRLSDEQSFLVRLLGAPRPDAEAAETPAGSEPPPAPPSAPGAPNQETA